MSLLLEIEDVVPVRHFPQLIDELAGVLVHHFVKVLQDIEVEGRSDHLAAFMPLATRTGEQAQSQPGVHQIIGIRLGNQCLATEYKLIEKLPELYYIFFKIYLKFTSIYLGLVTKMFE